jgi:Ca2+-binding RTX toxin-like protein
VHGNDGDDLLIPGRENENDLVLKGNDGDDVIDGSGFSSRDNQRAHFLGGKGDDVILGPAKTGDQGNDPNSRVTLDGGSGNDLIFGGFANYDEYLIGGIGEDRI